MIEKINYIINKSYLKLKTPGQYSHTGAVLLWSSQQLLKLFSAYCVLTEDSSGEYAYLHL